MRCADARRLASEYLDGELDAAAARSLEEHLRTCTSCPPIAEALKGVLAQLRSLADAMAPAATLAGVLSALPPHPTTNQGEP